MWREADDFQLILYGEPYSWYMLEYSPDMYSWATTTTSNRHEELAVLPVAGSQRFYRTGLVPGRP